MTSLEHLFGIVYQYYPRNLWDSDPAYDETIEHRRLVEARRRAGRDDDAWRNLLERIARRFPDRAVQNNSLHLPAGGFDACYSALLWLDPRDGEAHRAIGFLVSFIAPHFLIYVARSTDRHMVRYSFSPDESLFADAIAEELRATHPAFTALPPEIGLVPVPDVVTGNRGLGEATLFDCLFTDNR